MVTHVFGAPAAAAEAEGLARRAGIPLVFDAAHGLGAQCSGRPVGSFGDAEAFSLSPTKVVVAGEGGLVSTRSDDVARHVRLGRDYGNPGNYDTQFAGLNARMSELHAAVALESLDGLDEHLDRREAIADRYGAGLAAVPGIEPQAVPATDRSTWKDFTVIVDPDVAGLSRDVVVSALRAEGVDTRCYFSPPVHQHRAYAAHRTALPITDWTAARVVSLPIWRELPDGTVDAIVEILAALTARGDEVAAGADARTG
jgi:dTDP-4-amino-4,6-dideoxygalactose transaminase